MRTLDSPYTPIQVHKEDYCDLFPKKQLVLLTPHSPNKLEVFDPNMHYVLGGYINRRNNAPFLMAKAKQLQLQTAYLPMKDYNSMKPRYHTMPLNHIVKILLEVRHSQDWNQAFNHIAGRFKN